ncbi:MAG: sulfur carrier protein ThiS adenylyltransferase ThiF [Spirochaetaceae bacterium]|nr:sulfur carrier protein ThiS adenylyltransferase ThiF [Spirochaetaceae bacterium]
MKREQLRAMAARARVGIAGAGGLGSNCAISLLRSGVLHLVIADFDLVSEANLERQQYFRSQRGLPKVEALADNLRLIDPAAQIEIHDIRLDPASILNIYAGCDIIVEAFDDPEAKRMLIETILMAFPEKQIVTASGLAGFGNLEAIRIIHKGKLHLCGDFSTEVSADNPPLAPRVAIVANIEADIVLSLIASGTAVRPLATKIKGT